MNNKEYKSINIDGTIYTCLFTKKYINRKKWEQKPKNLNVLSIIPGTVIQICFAVGDHVQKGDLLLLYEAMKMENRIYAPENGMIQKIDVKVGDKLPKNALMITISK